MFEKSAAIRLAIYSVGGVICAALVLFGVIDQTQADSVLTQLGGLVGIALAALAAFNVNRTKPEAKAPVDPARTVGAFQIG
ncbi:hypothetical protein AB0G00_24160 [Nocardia salmonicida]|uniref:phage holin n=1 Tax=Nocardia salmonicida TaxID=53431 RepID=UPI0033E1BA43